MPYRRRKTVVAVVSASLPAWLGVAQPAASQSRETAVFINGAALASDTLAALQSRYQTQVPPGRYWYDPVSGVWGREGGPAEGQIAPGHALGGSLRADASRGSTRVFVNGRELHARDVQALQRCTQVVPGRYWVEASGIGSYEGGPPSFSLAALCASANGGAAAGAAAAAPGPNASRTAASRPTTSPAAAPSPTAKAAPRCSSPAAAW